jgi:hypothetical protein
MKVFFSNFSMIPGKLARSVSEWFIISMRVELTLHTRWRLQFSIRSKRLFSDDLSPACFGVIVHLDDL